MADDALYRAFASRQRRRLLAMLRDVGRDGTSVDELATLLCGYDATDASTMGTADDRDRLLAALTHVHLPHLDDVGLVEYDRTAGTVAPRPLDPGVEDLLDRSVAAESARRRPSRRT
ncbi:ArsR family transcriptional regulator [Halobaculum sp. WSA2]|uniref:ArsR family transcriptional regulator n=1 Tax=Halobaculum saliterrae TaxID=2073113 RepID=A0A6B0SSQ9_9EURY|nr:ArsR family transcriptional regulator [Halobaculum saliterrae]